MTNKDEAVIRVRFDTTPAKQDLDDLDKESSKTAKTIRKGIAKVVSAGVRYTGAGIAFGAGMEAVKSGAMSGVSDVFGEAFGGWGAQLQQWVLGDLAPEARASAAARDQMIEAYRFAARDKIPPAAVDFYNQTKAFMFEGEKGRARFEADTRFYGPGFMEIIEKVGKQLKESLLEAANALGEYLTSPSKWGSGGR